MVVNLTPEEEDEMYHIWMIDRMGYQQGLDSLEYLSFLQNPRSNDRVPWSAAFVTIAAFSEEEIIFDHFKKNCPEELSTYVESIALPLNGMYNLWECDGFIFYF